MLLPGPLLSAGHSRFAHISEDPRVVGIGETLMMSKISSALAGRKRMATPAPMLYRGPAAKRELDKRYEFGPFQLISVERQLLRDGSPVPITNKAFETLLALVGRSGHLVEKSELMAAVWKDSYVEEGNLAVTISMIRKALGDSRRDQKYIQTITKRGYRFVAATRLVPVPTVLGIVGRSIQESLKRAQLFRG